MKPFIARDTKQPLIVLGHYEVAADGSIMREAVRHQLKPAATDADRALLAKHGQDGLEAKGFHGVIDRLNTSGVLT